MGDASQKIREYEQRHGVADPSANDVDRIDVEPAFDKFVGEFGGAKISDLLENKAQLPLNADYYFGEHNVIAELKTIEGAFSGYEGMRALQQAFIDAGERPSALLGWVLGRDEPSEKVKRLVQRRLRRSIEERIKKARKQLRTSKAQIGNGQTRSLLIVAVDEAPLFGHKNMVLTLSKLMGDNFWDEHIDGVVYMNPNTPTQIHDEGMVFSGWFPMYRDDEINKELSAFVDLLGNKWLTFLGTASGSPNPILELDSSDGMLAVLGGEALSRRSDDGS